MQLEIKFCVDRTEKPLINLSSKAMTLKKE